MTKATVPDHNGETKIRRRTKKKMLPAIHPHHATPPAGGWPGASFPPFAFVPSFLRCDRNRCLRPLLPLPPSPPSAPSLQPPQLPPDTLPREHPPRPGRDGRTDRNSTRL